MKKTLVLVVLALVTLGGTVFYQYVIFNDNRLHVVFCDVGQGDAILITTPSNKYILMDGGPDRAVLDCLSRHLPFWERTIDLVLLSHPHADHFVGFLYVLERYTILSFATENLRNNTSAFEELNSALSNLTVPKKFVAQGDRWSLSDGVAISIVGPTTEFLMRKDPDGLITDSAESASLTVLVSYGDFSVLLTGDAPVDEMHEVGERLDTVDVLQIPHHGSTTGLDRRVLVDFQPKLAVISVGKNNYGHPKKQILNLLQEQKIPVVRTDQRGDVEVISDGKTWYVK